MTVNLITARVMQKYIIICKQCFQTDMLFLMAYERMFRNAV